MPVQVMKAYGGMEVLRHTYSYPRHIIYESVQLYVTAVLFPGESFRITS
jgi:hypothetical protein